MLNWIWFGLDPWDTPGVTGLQLDFSHWSHSGLDQSPIFKLTSLSAQPAPTSTASLWKYYGIQCQKTYWNKIDKIHFSLFISTTSSTPLQKVIMLLMSELIHWWINADLQWHQLPPSALMDASHPCSWTYVCPDYIRIPWTDPLPLRVHLSCSRFSPWFPAGISEGFVTSKDWGKGGNQYFNLPHTLSPVPLSHTSSGSWFLLSSFAAYVPVEALFMAFDILHQIQLQHKH